MFVEICLHALLMCAIANTPSLKNHVCLCATRNFYSHIALIVKFKDLIYVYIYVLFSNISEFGKVKFLLNF